MRSLPFYTAAAIAAIVTTGMLGCRPQPASSPSAIRPVRRTEVIVFNPPLPANVEDGGRCWTDSIAVNRPGAWRCMRENFIYDPCFEVRGAARQVICGADPIKGDRGFVFKLTEPLPAPAPAADRSVQPWLIELADGSVCQAATGTMAAIEGESVRYPCSSPGQKAASQSIYTGLLGAMYPGKVWAADKVSFTIAPKDADLPFKLLKRETVAIRRVWE